MEVIDFLDRNRMFSLPGIKILINFKLPGNCFNYYKFPPVELTKIHS